METLKVMSPLTGINELVSWSGRNRDYALTAYACFPIGHVGSDKRPFEHTSKGC